MITIIIYSNIIAHRLKIVKAKSPSFSKFFEQKGSSPAASAVAFSFKYGRSRHVYELFTVLALVEPLAVQLILLL